VVFFVFLACKKKLMRSRKLLFLFTALFIGIISVLITLTSCKPSPGKAEAYYNTTLNYEQAVLEKEDVLIQFINREMQKSVADSANSVIQQNIDTASNKSEITQAYTDFCSQIDASLGQAKKLDEFDGKTTLKDATLKLLETYKTLSGNEYKEVVEIVKIPAVLYTNEDDNRFMDLTIRIDTCLQNEIDQYTRTCKEFARDYKFILEEPIKENAK
jgi:hypothetical protein